jgi:midasin (ATPase involved in ribosome maturation)
MFYLEASVIYNLPLYICETATAQEWEGVASQRVSIAPFLAEITNLIISWRKMELRFWKNLSEQSYKRFV